jgi:hypothetical protein
MMGALLYLQLTGSWNRLTSRLKRLRQPKYLIGAIVGGLYIYFYFVRFIFFGSREEGRAMASWITPENSLMIECGVGLLLCVVILAAWIVPNKRAALTFTEAEIAFLFPAPVTRRTLIQFKLLRSQLGILFTVLIFTLISRRAGGNPLVHALGWWLVLSVLNLHFMGVSFLRTLLLDRGITHWTRRVVILGGVSGIGVGVGIWVWTSLPGLEVAGDSRQLLEQVRQLLTTGPIPILIYPFRLLVRPYLAGDLIGFMTTAWPALLILVGHYWFVVRADVAFEEASVEASRRQAQRTEAARAGRLQGGEVAKPRRAPFELGATGAPELAFFWKNLIAAGRIFNKRLLLILAIMSGVAFVAMSGESRADGVMGLFGVLALMFLVWSILLGPQVLAQDLRQDVRMADLIKVYPLKGWQVVLGELLAPVVILTCIQWLLIPLAVGGLLGLDREAQVPLGLIGGLAIALAIMAPALNVLSFIIPNASVLLLPAWFQTDKSMPHGIEAMGQRIVLLLGQMLMLLIAALPAGLVFTLILLLGEWVAGWWIAAPLAGLAATAVVLVEVAVALVLMGRWFEQLDVSEMGAP